MELTLIENENLTSAVVDIDGRYFKNCSYRNCELHYTGQPFHFENCIFIGCSVDLEGAASLSLQFFAHFKMITEEWRKRLLLPPQA